MGNMGIIGKIILNFSNSSTVLGEVAESRRGPCFTIVATLKYIISYFLLADYVIASTSAFLYKIVGIKLT